MNLIERARILRIESALIAAGLVLAACVSGGEEEPDQQDVTTIEPASEVFVNQEEK